MNCKVTASWVVAAVSFLFISAFPVSADTLTIYDGYYGVENVTLTSDSNDNTRTIDVGMILVDSGGDTWAFCVDIDVPLGSSGDYEFTTTDPGVYDDNLLYVEWLLDEFADDAYADMSNYQGAALQLAVWEILIDLNIDDFANDYDLNLASSNYSNDGTFWYSSSDPYDNIDLWYNYYINSLINELDAGFIYASSGNYFVADFVDKQDIIVNVVPEPTTALLLGFGLLGLCAAGRKRI